MTNFTVIYTIMNVASCLLYIRFTSPSMFASRVLILQRYNFQFLFTLALFSRLLGALKCLQNENRRLLEWVFCRLMPNKHCQSTTWVTWFIDSVPSLGVYYFCRWLGLYVRLSVCHKLQIASSFLFLDGIEAIFWPSFLHDPSTKRCSSVFDLGPFSPKFGTKSPISWFVWHIDWRCLGLLGVFGDGRFNGTIQNVVGPTLVAMATKFWQIWAIFEQNRVLVGLYAR